MNTLRSYDTEAKEWSPKAKARLAGAFEALEGSRQRSAR